MKLIRLRKKVSDANPGKEVQVSTNGTATVTDPKSRISHQISGDKLVESMIRLNQQLKFLMIIQLDKKFMFILERIMILH